MSRIPPPEPGIYFDVPFATYLAWDAASASMLKVIRAHCPAMAKYQMDHPQTDVEDKDWAVFGRLFHLLCTEPDKAKTDYIAIPPTYPSEKPTGRGAKKVVEISEKPWTGNATYCKTWLQEQREAGRTPIRASGDAQSPGIAEAHAMADAVKAHPMLGRIIANGRAEVSVVWRDPLTGVLCKGRYDIWVPAAVVAVDLKSARNARTEIYWSDAFKRGLHIQVAMYIDSLHALGKVPADKPVWFLIGAAEKAPPHLVNVFEIYDDPGDDSYDWLDLGRKDYRSLLATYAQCLKTGVWPGYSEEPQSMMLPPWALKELNELRKLEMRT